MADALEAAVINMVLQGDAAVSQRAGQVTADLSSAERAGRKAESAAEGAESAFSELSEQVTHVTERLHLALRVAERLASAAGIDSPALEGFGQGVSTALAAQRLLAPLDAVLPGASLIGGAAAGIFTGASAFQNKEAEEEKKNEEQAERIAKKVAEEQQKKRDKSVADELVRQAAASMLSNLASGSRTVL